MKNSAIIGLLALVPSLLWGFELPADTSLEEQGLAIAREQKARDTGWGDTTADMVMTLRNAAGKENTRRIRSASLEVLDDGDLSLSVFDHPADIKGTSFLTHSKTLGQDDQWLYLPALKRVKRINSRTRSGPFMGSEFAYEDMSSFEVSKFNYSLNGEEACGDLDCYVVESYPKDEFSGYSKKVSWVDSEHFRVHEVRFYNRRGDHVKTLKATGYQLYEGRYWRADQFLMVNHKTGKSTEILWRNFEFNSGLDAGDFDVSALKRAR